MSNFLKSTWFRCVAVLLAISVIAGGLLAILNDVLYVSDDERTSRALKKIYGYEVSSYSIELDTGRGDLPFNDEKGFGTIDKVYVVGDTSLDHDLLFRSTGTKGYKGGTITLWVKIEVTSQGKNITKVIVEGFEKQTLMSKLDGTFYNGFYKDVTQLITSGEIFAGKTGDNVILNPVSGATMSANAACNAVNCVLEYVRGL